MSRVYSLNVEQSHGYDSDASMVAFRLKASVDEVDPATDTQYIFCYKVVRENEAVFSHVCSPYDLETYPENSPDDGDLYFRLPSVDLVFTSDEFRQEAYAHLIEDVELLGNALDNLESLGASTIVVPSVEAKKYPKGVVAGDNTNQAIVTFPVVLDNASPHVYLYSSTGIPAWVEGADEGGFTIKSTRAIATTEWIYWAVL